MSSKKITYIVAGTGGMPPQPIPDASGQPISSDHEVTYDAAMKALGYLYVTISKTSLQTQFWPLHGGSTPFDPVNILF